MVVCHLADSMFVDFCYDGVLYLQYVTQEMAELNYPTYKELTRLLGQAEAQAGVQLSTAELLTAKFLELYPHIKIGRPGRFLDTVRRINAPIRSGNLTGEERRLYLERQWVPRVRNVTSECQGLCNLFLTDPQ